MEGRIRDKGVTWFPELVDKRKYLFINCDPFGKNVSKVTEITIQIMAKRQQNFRYLKPLLYGERAKRARHSQVCSIENRGYIYYSTRKFCSYNP